MTKKEEQRERRRDEIINAAIDLFSRRGYGSTKVTDIISNAGVSMGLLFHYFGTKNGLYHEIIKIGCANTNFTLPLEDSPIETFTRITGRILSFIEEQPLAAKMFVLTANALHDDSIPPESKELLSAVDIITRSIPLIEKGQYLGEIRPGNSRSLSAAFWGAITGIAQEIALNPDITYPSPDWIVAILKNN